MNRIVYYKNLNKLKTSTLARNQIPVLKNIGTDTETIYKFISDINEKYLYIENGSLKSAFKRSGIINFEKYINDDIGVCEKYPQFKYLPQSKPLNF